MSAVILDEKKIDSLVSTYQDAERIIYAGSDEHLDILLDLQANLNKLIKLSADINEGLENAFNSLDEHQARFIVDKLSPSLETAKQLIISLKRLPMIAEGIKSYRKELYQETLQMDEFVQDISRYKLNQSGDLTDLLNEISSTDD